MLLLLIAWTYEEGLPQRWGSQSYGTLQPQTSMGLAQTQFVPSHPSVGQGNWCQSQGAAQAPIISQTGHMGQGMGQGRGQDF